MRPRQGIIFYPSWGTIFIQFIWGHRRHATYFGTEGSRSKNRSNTSKYGFLQSNGKPKNYKPLTWNNIVSTKPYNWKADDNYIWFIG
jgi:hypothetical protein